MVAITEDMTATNIEVVATEVVVAVEALVVVQAAEVEAPVPEAAPVADIDFNSEVSYEKLPKTRAPHTVTFLMFNGMQPNYYRTF